jgi:hypothetical protein
MSSKIGSLRHSWRRIVLVNFGVLIGLYLLAEIALHIISSDSNPLPLLAKNVLRIRHPVYNHTLRPKYHGFDIWGPRNFWVLTNSLGFRDASTRDVPLVADRKRIVFIGDSFTEGLGVPYEETFVGRFASAFPDLDVLNAAVVSYSPSIYYEKLKYFLDVGLRFDEAIVYIDIADIHDEATNYSYDEHGVLQWVGKTGAEGVGESWSNPKKKAWWESAFYVADYLNQVRLSQKWAREIEHASLQDLMHSGLYRRDLARSSWTYDAKASGYGSMGVEGGIQKAKRQMDRLYEALSSHGVALSVGVYPWTQQLLYDSENSRQVKIWREWCAGKCKSFFDHFPAFFRYKEKDPEFVRNLFIWGDIHYNARGNQILAEDLIEKYRLQ